MKKTMSQKISIIILNYNGWEDTLECLKSLEPTIEKDDYDISLIVVDNNSTNESVGKINNYLEQKYKDQFLCTDDLERAIDVGIILFKSYENFGFSGGNNIGIRIAKKKESKYIMMLNNDTVVTENFLSPLVNMLESNESLGIVSPKIIDYYHQHVYTLGGYYSKYKGSGYSYCNMDKGNKQKLNYLSGCCWLIRTSAIEHCGLMDEAYFLYVEDVDYSCTFYNKGYQLSCTNESVIFHKEGRSTKLKPTLYYYNTRNRLYLCDKLKYNFTTKMIFLCYFLSTRLYYWLKYPELREYIKQAFIDYHCKKFGKLRTLKSE